MPSLPTLPTAPVTLTGISSGTFGTPVYNWISFLADPPKFVGSNAAGFTLGTGANASIPIDTEEIDSANGHDLVTNNTRYTGQYPGRYLVIASAVFAANATGRRGAFIAKNGTSFNTEAATVPAGVAGVIRVQASRLVILNGTTDYVEAQAFQDSGGNLTGTTGGLQVVWVGTT